MPKVRKIAEAEDVLLLRQLVRLVAMQLANGRSGKDAIGLLGQAGMDRTEIAAVCGTTPEVVSVRLAEVRRKRKRR